MFCLQGRSVQCSSDDDRLSDSVGLILTFLSSTVMVMPCSVLPAFFFFAFLRCSVRVGQVGAFSRACRIRTSYNHLLLIVAWHGAHFKNVLPIAGVLRLSWDPPATCVSCTSNGFLSRHEVRTRKFLFVDVYPLLAPQVCHYPAQRLKRRGDVGLHELMFTRRRFCAFRFLRYCEASHLD